MKRLLFTIFALFLCVAGQRLQSPCPGLFAYQADESGVYGLIQLKLSSSTGSPVSRLHLRANFTIAAQLTSTYVGQIQTLGGDQLLQKFNQGSPINYRVNFPVSSPLPRLSAIVVNGNTLCYGAGDQPTPGLYITTISLDHMLYLKGTGVGVQNTDFFNYNSGSNIDFFDVDNGNTQVFTINDVDDRWSPDSFNPQDTFDNKHQTRPEYEQPVTFLTDRPRPEQARPEYSRPSRPKPEYTPSRPKPEYTPSQPKPDYNLYYPETKPTRQPPPPPPPPSVPPTMALPSTPPRLPAMPAAVECGVIAGGNERIPLIYNGNTYNRGEWPWLVAVYKRQEGSLTFICSGTLLSDRHVLSAAHCMQQRSRMSTIKDIVVKVGVYNLEDWGDDISVTRTLQAAAIHESYNATTLENDILVFTLERTVEFNNYIRPACLWNGNTDLSRIVGASGVVAGWGASEVGPVGQGQPRMVRIPVVSTSACRASKPEFHKLTSSKTLCAGDRNGSGPCLGDSGGGLYILDNGRWRLRGVVSLSLRPANGDNTCNLNEYIVFTDTAQYLNWIRKILSQNYFDT